MSSGPSKQPSYSMLHYFESTGVILVNASGAFWRS